MKPPLRILCLHGFRQNGKVFEELCAPMTHYVSEFGPLTEFIFLDAPHVYREAKPNGKPAQLVWWKANDAGTVYEGWEQSVDYLKAKLRDLGDVSGILGFSQGAAVASALIALRSKGDKEFQGGGSSISNLFSLTKTEYFQPPSSPPPLDSCSHILPQQASVSSSSSPPFRRGQQHCEKFSPPLLTLPFLPCTSSLKKTRSSPRLQVELSFVLLTLQHEKSSCIAQATLYLLIQTVSSK